MAFLRGWVLMGVTVDAQNRPVRAAFQWRVAGGGGQTTAEKDGTFGLRGLRYESLELAATPSPDGVLPPPQSPDRWAKL